jgi:hypothetical protein
MDSEYDLPPLPRLSHRDRRLRSEHTASLYSLCRVQCIQLVRFVSKLADYRSLRSITKARQFGELRATRSSESDPVRVGDRRTEGSRACPMMQGCTCMSLIASSLGHAFSLACRRSCLGVRAFDVVHWHDMKWRAWPS